MSQLSEQGKRPDPARLATRDPLTGLSARLASGERVEDAAVVERLGAAVLPAFRYAQDALQGRVRKTTGEPAFCHSADIAIRGRKLCYDSEHTLVVCLLHDVVEEQSSSLAEIAVNLGRVADQFGDQVERDVRLLTNRFSVIIREVTRGGLEREPFSHTFLDRFRDGLDAYQLRQPLFIQREFTADLDRLRGFLPAVDVAAGKSRERSDRGYHGAWELRLQAYQLFIQETCDDAAQSFGVVDDARGAAEVPLVCKLLDLIDNLRTSPVVIRRSLERTLVKAEMFLDTSFYLHSEIHQQGVRSTFVTAYDLLKYYLVQQLRQRRIALDSLSDTRFGGLAVHLFEEVARLEAKYHVNRAIEPHIEALSSRIRALNSSA